MKFPAYEIRSVDDFFSVPQDRWPAMLRDFASFLECGAAALDAMQPNVRVRPVAFIWIDDDLRGVRATHLDFRNGFTEAEQTEIAGQIQQAIEPFAVASQQAEPKETPS